AAPPDAAVLDEPALREHFGDDDALIKEVSGVFLETCPTWLTELQAAAAAHDANRLQRAAHTVKGAVSRFGEHGAYEAADQLEQIAKSGNLSGAAAACTALGRELQRLQGALQNLCRSQPLL